MKIRFSNWILVACGWLASCGSTQQLSLGTEAETWKLTSLNNQKESAFAEGESFTIRFSPKDSTINGVGACNRFFGKYLQPKKGEISIKTAGSTMMACPHMDLEQSYITTLNKVNGFTLTNNQLTLTENKQTVATFSLAKSIEDSHHAANSLDYWGEYTGTFPAADCPGIKIKLQLNRDMTYTMDYDYIDRNSRFTEKGSYSINKNRITLRSGSDVQYFKVGETQLTKLDSDQQEITGALAKMYILKKR